MGSIYDGQAERAICEFCDLATRFRDPTSESLESIQSARAEHDLCAAFSEHDRRRFAYSAARSRMLSELAPVITTTLSLIPGMKFCFLPSTFHFHI